MTIPAKAHFIWFGADLPWIYVLALRTAASHGGFERVVLHHEPALRESPGWPEIVAIPDLEARAVEPEALLESCPRGPALVDLYRQLKQPAARANMVRAGVLFTEGGVYLDTDTITLADFGPLRAEAEVFCGEERIVFPADVRRSRSPLRRGPAALRSGVRSALRALPRGYRAFRVVEPFYPCAANNAVFASDPGHPFVAEMLERMVDMPEERRLVRFALGTHLLQEMVASFGGKGLVVHPPAVFYPLGPEISTHWFRTQSTEPNLGSVLSPETRLVHWYASVRTSHIAQRADANWVDRHRHNQLFSALVHRTLESRPDALSSSP